MAKSPKKKVMAFAPAMSAVFRDAGKQTPAAFTEELKKLTDEDKVYFVAQLEAAGYRVSQD